ncbi:potassium-transporting ATPase subunit C [Streptomyces fuscigenes]|uniref:potassium-transporting ATPase subunit C n=1 Tax=Streptomyces fuscigenes TaxID=1528880 RepID=UPI001F4277CA|nr:potassium-transporting ATPase subunit C [Streptomyces fuscigenes]MCF3961764.1 potassium-transporting ATPase subunit C [Streptomyces fuscigenes]
MANSSTSAAATARLLLAGLRALLVLSVLTGVIYPLVVTGVAQAAFPGRANGSEIKDHGKVVGSSSIGQTYDLPLKKGQESPDPDLHWFQPRPSAGLGSNRANGFNTQYDLLVSGASNLAGNNKDLISAVKDRKAAVVKDNSVPGYTVRPSQVPADAVTSSGSGLDPDISPAYANLQVHRVAEVNHLTVAQVQKIVDDHAKGRILGFVGDPRVDVLQLNIAVKDLVAAHKG